MAHYVAFVSVDSFGLDRAISFLVIAVLGGARTIAGTILGALFVVVTIFLPKGIMGLLPQPGPRVRAGRIELDGADVTHLQPWQRVETVLPAIRAAIAAGPTYR